MTRALWTSDEAIAATGATASGAIPETLAGVSIDSRTIKPGELYVAIKGDVHDGHDFARAAFANGAGAALVSRERARELAGAGALFAVDDPLRGLEALGRAARARSDARVIAVTGSAGKTGVKEALGLVLSRQGDTHFSVASFNNHWGVPLTLARMPASARFGVFEIGMNHAGEITPLTAMVRPHVAIVTAVLPVHLAYFSSVDAIADAKAEIFSGLEPGGVAIINADQPQTDRLIARAAEHGARVVLFGESARAEARLLSVALHADGSDVAASIDGEAVRYSLRNPGRHVAMNSLAVLAAARAVGADVARVAADLAEVPPPTGRGAREIIPVAGGAVTLIDESYNANPASMRAAIENLGRIRAKESGRRIAVVGDMLELGDRARDFHAELASAMNDNGVDLVFACGPMMRALWDELPPSRRGAYAADSAALTPAVIAAIGAHDIVSVKGSLGSRMGPVVKAIRARLTPPAKN
ncbi:MAG: UDP-N-acetylmuramoylalanyl-D-glutamyl-2, 6-diaminopimelate--D-alanyl-D-alanine ligase [Rhizobiales bacterium 65-9]|nr:MAG: UDP-N-acetylmuramoylalanyl-D-glutamyl-2, 6-diaminopimelate--D-alanyl-D-alanine ligase [Rhizobiales bacterium 65-9]